MVRRIAQDHHLRYDGISFDPKAEFSHMWCPNDKAPKKKRRYYLKFAECNKIVVCHEMAHLFHDQKTTNWRKEADHGPEFLKTYLDFLVRYCYIDRTILEASLESQGIAYK